MIVIDLQFAVDGGQDGEPGKVGERSALDCQIAGDMRAVIDGEEVIRRVDVIDDIVVIAAYLEIKSVKIIAIVYGEYPVTVAVERDISEGVVVVIAVRCAQDTVLVAVVGEGVLPALGDIDGASVDTVLFDSRQKESKKASLP